MGKSAERVTCEKCGLEYTAGAPHAMFCRGRVADDAECVDCGEEDKDFLSECPSCGEPVCDCCKEEVHECL